jgi:CheY-like chemotaxis protein
VNTRSRKPIRCPSSRPAPASGIVPSSHRKAILLVDPDAESRLLLAHWLSARYDIFEAQDGLEAVSLARLMPMPALVVLEVALPTVDGFKVAKILKRDTKLRCVPLVFLTSRMSPKDVAQGIIAGARRYLFKPFVAATLCEAFTKMIDP